MKRLFVGCAIAALATSSAYAQSSGSVDFEEKTIVVTGTRTSGVAGHIVPDTPKAKAVLDSTFIQRQQPGQSINEIINQLPGVSFQNNDPFGSSGGTLSIRGFDASRISQTFDGLPLNDTGNYALYSNQQLDPELIDQVNVNLGTTDVDSPTAAASGSTVNYRTRNPTEDFHARIQGSAGSYHFYRIFGVIDTGTFTPFGTRAWFSASNTENRLFQNNYGKIKKTQVNAKIYQPIGSNGDYITVRGHYNENRNTFGGSVPLRVDTVFGRVAGSTSGNRFPLNTDERKYFINSCSRIAPAAGSAQVETTTSTSLTQTATNCGAIFDYRWNPSNTGNIAVQSRFTLADGLVLNVDPSFQYTKANGGGLAAAVEGFAPASAVGAANAGRFTGYVGTTPYFGRDLNGDGDLLDTVLVAAPSHTRTYRYGVISSLRYDVASGQTIRAGYTLDYGNHRQTGETGLVSQNGVAPYFPVDNPLTSVTGSTLQKRDRQSYAILHQGFGEYRGEFFDRKLVVTAGVTAKFFTRDLTNNCFTTSGGGNVSCFTTETAAAAAYQAANPYAVSAAGIPTGVAPPQKRIFHYNKVLPSGGLTYNISSAISAYGSYSKGLQVPGTDNLYSSFYYPTTDSRAKPKPETTDNFDLGVRYKSSKIQAQFGGWYTIFQNRLAQAFDRDLNITIYRNLGRVEKYGFDGSIAYKPIQYVSLYAFGSILKSKIKNNIDAGTNCTTQLINSGLLGCTTVGQIGFFQTKGQRESGFPTYTVGGRIDANYGPVSAGVQFKRTGPRFYNDQNTPVYQLYTGGTAYSQVYGAKIPAYNIVDLDVRVSLEPLVHNDRTYFQFNVTNLFNKLYFGGFSGGTTQNTSVIFGQIGSPRAFMGTLNVGF